MGYTSRCEIFLTLLSEYLLANCYCGDNGGTQLVYYDEVNNRYSRYAECIISIGLDPSRSNNPNTTINLCFWEKYLEIIPAFILSPNKQKFIESKIKMKRTFIVLLQYEGLKLCIFSYFFFIFFSQLLERSFRIPKKCIILLWTA